MTCTLHTDEDVILQASMQGRGVNGPRDPATVMMRAQGKWQAMSRIRRGGRLTWTTNCLPAIPQGPRPRESGS